MKKNLIAIVVIGTIGSATILTTSSFFSDIETSTQNTFTAGKLDLKVDGQNQPGPVISLTNFLPGDSHEFTKNLRVDDNPAWIFMHIKDLKVDPAQGPQFQNYLTYNLKSNDTVVIPPISFANAISCWIPLGQIPGSTDLNLHQTFSLDSSVTNWAQGNSLTFTEDFFATQVRNNPSPTLPDIDTGRIWSSALTSCLSDFKSLHVLTFNCTSGCSGSYVHSISLSPPDLSTGSFSGTGFYNANNSYTWNISGVTTGVGFTSNISYTSQNPGYTIAMTGIISLDGTVTGSASSNAGQNFTFSIN